MSQCLTSLLSAPKRVPVTCPRDPRLPLPLGITRQAVFITQSIVFQSIVFFFHFVLSIAGAVI